MVVQTVIIAAAAVVAGAAAAVFLRRKRRSGTVREEAAAAEVKNSAAPLSDRPPAPVQEEVPAPVRAERKQGEPRHILIVDDQPAIRMLLGEVFRTAGFVVHESGTGRHAVELAAQHPIDVALLDLKMPDMDGVEVLEAIRRIDESVRVVMISAYGDGDKIDTARRLGVGKFFTKPFDIEKLRDYVLEELQ